MQDSKHQRRKQEEGPDIIHTQLPISSQIKTVEMQMRRAFSSSSLPIRISRQLFLAFQELKKNFASILHYKSKTQKTASDCSGYLEKHVSAQETRYLLQSIGTLQKAKNPVLSGMKLLGNHLSYSRTVNKSFKLWNYLIPQVTESKALTFNTARY